jgi:hypothetical protein
MTNTILMATKKRVNKRIATKVIVKPTTMFCFKGKMYFTPDASDLFEKKKKKI